MLFLYTYRRYVALCGTLLTFFLYAMLLTAHGMPMPRFVLDQQANSVKHTGSYSWRHLSDVLAGRKYAVLTFDDGPYGYGLDEQILATLRKHHAHAVFFLVCNHINEQTRGTLAKFEGEGDVIGNHTFDHLDLAKLSQPEIEHQIESCNQRIAGLTGKRPYYFRPPFGSTTPTVAKAAKARGMQQMLWNANSEDSWVKQPQQILDFSLGQTEDQSILLLHEKPATAAVLDDMLTQLEQRGFQFVLPDQLSENVALN
jgi:peptidoglycan/xylan/chitin deacetylase (PgdA/CDA1 family)